MGVSWQIFPSLIVCFLCQYTVRVITALLLLLCKLIIHTGYATYPGLDSHGHTRALSKATSYSERRGLLKSVWGILCSDGVSQLLSYSTLHHTAPSSTEVYSLRRTHSEEIISHILVHTSLREHTHTHTLMDEHKTLLSRSRLFWDWCVNIFNRGLMTQCWACGFCVYAHHSVDAHT